MVSAKQLGDIANLIRRDSIEMTSRAESGHPTSSMSCAEIMSVLFFDKLKYNVDDAYDLDNDEFVLSKGHASPALYSALWRANLINHNPLVSLRKLKSPIEGHPIPSEHVPWVRVATGSLGQGLSVGVGMALAAKKQKRKFRTYVLVGDSEFAEGSIYEALELASHYKLNNLVMIVDVNRLGQRGETMLGHDFKKYILRIKSFGWEAIVIDGHNIDQVSRALSKRSDKPLAIIAKTFKGRGVSFLENKEGWHGKAVPLERMKEALDEILSPGVDLNKFRVRPPIRVKRKFRKKRFKSISYKKGELVANRNAYGATIANLAIFDESVIVVDAEVSNSTMSGIVKDKTPNQFVESYIAEQNMVGMALGLSKRGHNVFASSFSAFLSRAHDQIRMAALSCANLTICGSHAGVSIGPDGSSQMGLEDISMMRALPGSYVFYPSDAMSCAKITEACSNLPGIKYIRTTRDKTPVLYGKGETFEAGDFKVLKKSDKDEGVLVGSGISVYECLNAYEELKKKGISVAVIDLYCVKPFKMDKFIKFCEKHGKKVVVSEDHYPQGGIGEMLSGGVAKSGSNIRFSSLAVRGVPHSGKSEELLDKYRINSKWIVKAFISLQNC